LKNLTIIGAGSWGTALAIVLAPRFDTVKLWAFETEIATAIRATHENPVYLPGLPIPANVEPTTSLPEALDGAEIVLSVMPSHLVRGLYVQMLPHLTDSMVLVSASKGLETSTLLRSSEIIREIAGGLRLRLAVISGPTFAREVAELQPTALVVAGETEVGAAVQSSFSSGTFRLYTTTDITGVEIGGSIKNVVAIGAGVLHGLGMGHNALAALITRGLAEMTRLAVAMGGQPATLAGLAGLGDLVLTCNGDLSRNRTVGIELAKGRSLAEIVGGMKMVAEGVKTTGAAVELAKRHGVEMPIAQQMYELLHHGTPPRDAVRRLMERSLKGE
jgi:glycerol-3-phosphate dehydrogenase (NAD(P)+)